MINLTKYKHKLNSLFYEDSPEYINALNEHELRLLYEGLIFTKDIDFSVSVLYKQFGFIKTQKSNNKIKLEITRSNIEQLQNKFNKIEQLLNNLGWFLSNIQFFDLHNKLKAEKFNNLTQLKNLTDKYGFCYLIYEAKFDVEIKDKPSYMYHITPEFYVDKITKYGLTPKTKNKRYNYPARIYLSSDINSLEKIAPELTSYINPKVLASYDIIAFNIFKVDTSSINRLFKDPNFKTGYYTLENIHPNDLELIKAIQIKTN